MKGQRVNIVQAGFVSFSQQMQHDAVIDVLKWLEWNQVLLPSNISIERHVA